MEINLDKRLRIRSFSGIEISCMLSGSAVYGTSDPHDIDFVGLDRDGLHTELANRNFDSPDSSGNGHFVSLKKEFVNIILGNEDFVSKWIQAHDHLVEHPELGATKEGRIEVFEKFGAGFDWEGSLKV
jgi:hypothetical protein